MFSASANIGNLRKRPLVLNLSSINVVFLMILDVNTLENGEYH
ncbi:hypothetical protein CP97_14848 [Aurantiacibacter atlanticus]|uniref:Uncharacterized protein n=1 Tax=Aurantiacibacter atlanticus TaxID=1648404 RepID=A0A161IGJ8_9SPHN|nr:hypothetical protein CP97_14848 [Aurantiacibacter atlanticus]